jgi:acetyl-CoA carboxylase biotin carboxyl carrier protein
LLEENWMKPKIDYKEIVKLIDLLEERNLTHFELEIEGIKISIGRNPTSISEPGANPPPFSKTKNSAQTSQVEPDSEDNHKKDNHHYIISPMVGTFYRAPDPSSPSFVQTGEPVKKNQTLCIIEAMKLMNEIESDVDGSIEKIFVKSGKPVEYGQKLFAIKPE